MGKSKNTLFESDEDRRSRMNLVLFLETNERALEQLFGILRDRLGATYGQTVQRLGILRASAFENQKGILANLRIGLNSTQRNILTQVGMFGQTLLVKLELLWDCLRNGSLQPILKTLNSMLGSLAKVFSALHAVKEFKEMMEVAVDRLGPESDPIVLKLSDLSIPH